MSSGAKPLLRLGAAAGFFALVAFMAHRRRAMLKIVRFSSRSATRPRAPIGWIEFCAENPRRLRRPRRRMPRDVVLSTHGLERSRCASTCWVNSHIKPMTDLEHCGVVEKWSYPDDGYGDCEDYVLLKRRMLMQAGWPREALLITVVRDQHGDGHAVLTVKTDKGEFILDNQNDEILLWSDTGYRFVKRQSQADPNVWVSLGDPRAGAGHRNLALNATNKELRDPGHVPTPPRPQTGFARGRPSPRGRPHLFGLQFASYVATNTSPVLDHSAATWRQDQTQGLALENPQEDRIPAAGSLR